MRISTLIILLAATLGAAGAGLAGFAAVVSRRVERALPAQGRFVEVLGNRIHYLDVGSGPALVLIHGLGGQMRTFTYALVDRLSDRFRVVVMERPGSGYSRRARGAAARLGVQAAVTAEFINVLALERPLLVGHSLGGALALAVALQAPDRVGGLALVSPLTQPQSPDEVSPTLRSLGIRSAPLRALLAWTLAIPASIARSAAVLDAVFGPEPVPSDFGVRGGGLLGLRPRSFYETSTDFVAAQADLADLAARYPTLDLPIGLLFGTADRILEPTVHGALTSSRIALSTLETIEDGGHMIPVTRPTEVAAFITRVANRLPKPCRR